MEKTIEADTIRLLRECDAGIKMGVEAIQEVEQYSSDPELRQFLKSNMAEHEKLQSELQKLLDQYAEGADGENNSNLFDNLHNRTPLLSHTKVGYKIVSYHTPKPKILQEASYIFIKKSEICTAHPKIKIFVL